MKIAALRLAELSHLPNVSRREWSTAMRAAWDAGVNNLDFLRARLEVKLPINPDGKWVPAPPDGASRCGRHA